MGIWQRLVGKSGNTDQKNPASWLVDWVTGGQHTVSGESVTAETAMRLTAVYACVNVRSQDVAKLPLILYRRTPDGGKERATDHYLYNLMRNQPNPRHTAFEFRQMVQAHKDLRGNGYAWKEEDEVTGRVKAIWPVPSQYVTPLKTADGEPYYDIDMPPRPKFRVHGRLMIHLRNLTMDGWNGVSPITYHKETIGFGLGSLKYGAAFFGNNAQPNGALKVSKTLSKEAADALRTSWDQKFKGARNAHKLAIFDGGMEWLQTGMKNSDAEWLESRKFTNSEIYRLYRMPPHKVGDLEKATFSNIEHQSLDYVTDCLLAELVCWEQSLARDLLTDEERKQGYFFEFLVDALLRGDFKTRMEGFAIARNWGLFNADECRDMLNMNRIPGGVGQIYLQPLNMVPAGTFPTGAPAGEDAGKTPGGNLDNLSDDEKRTVIANLKAHIAFHEARMAKTES